jgi:Flp pilus assembly protein TadD
LYACGEYFAKTGEYAIARKNFEQALTLRQNMLPPDHPDIAENLGGLGAMCMNLHDFASASVYLKRAIPLYQSELGPNDRQVMDLRRMLAFCESQNTKRPLNPFKRK